MSFERAALLREMGLGPVWRLRTVAAEARPRERDDAETRGTTAQVTPVAQSDAAAPSAAPVRRGPPEAVGRSEPPYRPALPTGGSRRDDPGTPPVAKDARSSAGSAGEHARMARIAGLDWDSLEADIRACSACRLCEARNLPVPGVGDRAAEWMFVGEGPGAEEDRRGEPFVGAAGKLLDDMLAAIGLARDRGVYIANAVKCRPPLNRTPQADEISACLPYLSRQIALVKPRLLIALGRPAAQALLGEEVKINASRGRLFHREGTPVVVTYHPAYLLRNQADKARAWEDLCFARQALAELKRQDT